MRPEACQAGSASGGPPGLAPGVHLAWADSRLVALDVLRDRYFRVDRERSLALAALGREAAAIGAWRALSARGLTRERKRSDTENPWRRALGRQRLEAAALVGVLGACRWAANVLRREPFCGVLRAVAIPPGSCDGQDATMAAARTFLTHRPLYPRDYACMFEALAMRRYLAVRGQRANWIFGVRGAPFSAHCWLERDGVVLNDDPDTVAAYQVIMGV